MLAAESADIVVRRTDIKLMPLTVEADNRVDTVKVHVVFVSQRLDEAAENRRAPSVRTFEGDFLSVFFE